MIRSSEVDQILSALISNIKTETNEEILILTLKAFLNTVSLANKNFSTPVLLILLIQIEWNEINYGLPIY